MPYNRDKKIREFINVVINTEVMKKAREFLSKEAKNDEKYKLIFSDSGLFADFIYKIWFELFTNNFRGDAVYSCSGFEHVFVGEKSGKSGIGGYHFWYKFILDESEEEVDYQGKNYIENPEIIKHVCDILEGGRKAFEQRKNKYKI